MIGLAVSLGIVIAAITLGWLAAEVEGLLKGRTPTLLDGYRWTCIAYAAAVGILTARLF